ncbi:hypothetical protein Tco_0206604 [Tanacetum coccineum]
MEGGVLSLKRGRGGRGVKEKHNGLGTKVVDDYVEMSLACSTVAPTDETASGTMVTSTDVPSNITDIPNRGPETSASVYSTGEDTSSLSVVQTDIPAVEHTRPISYINVIPTEPVTPAGNGAVLFASLVTNEAVTNKVNFRSLDSDKPINAKAEVKIPKASILDVHSRFGFSLYGYFMGKRVAFSSWGCMDYARVLIDIRADWELKEDMVFAIPNLEDDEEVLHMVRVEYEWEPPRCGVCMVFRHDDMFSLSLKNLFGKPSLKRIVLVQVVRKKNSEVSKKATSSNNPFDALNTIEEGDELGSNGGSSNSGKKVVQDVASSTSSNLSNTPLLARINELESKKIEGKLMLLDDDGKPFKPSTSTLPSSYNVISKMVDDLVNEDNDSEVEEVYDETTTYKAFTGFNVNKASKSGSGEGNKSLYEQWKENHGEDPYDDDDFDDPGLTDAQMKFANAFDVNFRGQLR